MEPTQKLSRRTRLLIIAALALSVLALVEIGRNIVQRPETLLKSETPPSADQSAGPLNALKPDQRAEPLAPAR